MRTKISVAAAALALLVGSADAQTNSSGEELAPCDQLVALFMELARRSGSPVSEAEARQEVLQDNPTQAECAAMLALFPPLE
ncbi:MAG: hypothetical protein AAFP28_03655 [Pseudomonadota bacterium]